MNKKLLKELGMILDDAAAKRLWGEVTVDLKDGKVILLRQTIQQKIDEDYPRCQPTPATS